MKKKMTHIRKNQSIEILDPINLITDIAVHTPKKQTAVTFDYKINDWHKTHYRMWAHPQHLSLCKYCFSRECLKNK